jgi:3-methyladenine DNA glycosylase AlkD
VRKPDNDELVEVALQNIDRLKGEKEVLITKAISWVLRSMIKQYRKRVSAYIAENKTTLPAIAVRETMMKLKTGRKSG